MKLSVIIPVYNEELTIERVLDKVKGVNIPKEIIVVDDGSTDGTAEVLKRREKDITKVHISRINFGKGAAIRVGLTYITGDMVIIQDADDELDPNEFHQLIEPIAERGADVVYGSRFKKKVKDMPILTRLANKFLTFFANLLYNSHLTDMETAYKVFKREVIQDIKLKCMGFEFEPEITARILKKGYRICEVPISYTPRKVTEGKKITFTDGLRAIYCLLKCRFEKDE